MNEKDSTILNKIVMYIDDVESYNRGMKYELFSDDSKTMAATAFVLGQIGELTKSISAETIANNQDIPWNSMRGLRNRIVHDYENINLKMLWETIVKDLPELRTQLIALLVSEDGNIIDPHANY